MKDNLNDNNDNISNVTTEFLNENQIFPYVNKYVKPVIDGSECLYYCYNNFLFRYSIKENKLLNRMKMSENEIIKIHLCKEKLFLLTCNTENNKAEIIKIKTSDLNTTTITKKKSSESKNLESDWIVKLDLNILAHEKVIDFIEFQLEPNSTDHGLDQFFVLTNKRVLKVEYSNSPNQNSNVRSTQVNIFRFESSILPVNLINIELNFNISKTSIPTILAINCYKEILLLDIVKSVSVIIKDKNINKIYSLCQISKDVFSDFSQSRSNNNDELKTIEEISFAATDSFGKIHVLSHFLNFDKDNNVSLSDNFIISSFHWHSHKATLSSNSRSMFSGSEEGVVIVWDKNTFNKTFFPRICNSIYQLQAFEDGFVIVSNDQILVYNYLEYKTMAKINFLDEKAELVQKSIPTDSEKQLDHRSLFVNKITGIGYIVSKNQKIKKINLLTQYSKINAYSKELDSFYKVKSKSNGMNNEKILSIDEKFSNASKVEFSNIKISSLSKSKENFNFISLVETTHVNDSKYHCLKIFKIVDFKSNNLKLELLSIAENPHGLNEIDSMNFFKENDSKNSPPLLITESNGDFKIWKFCNKIGFICDFNYTIINENSLNLNKDNKNRCIYNYYYSAIEKSGYLLAINSNNHLYKLNITDYYLSQKTYIEIDSNVKVHKIDSLLDNLFITTSKSIIVLDLDSLKYLWDEQINDDTNVIIDSFIQKNSKSDNFGKISLLIDCNQDNTYTIITMFAGKKKKLLSYNTVCIMKRKDIYLLNCNEIMLIKYKKSNTFVFTFINTNKTKTTPNFNKNVEKEETLNLLENNNENMIDGINSAKNDENYRKQMLINKKQEMLFNKLSVFNNKEIANLYDDNKYSSNLKSDNRDNYDEEDSENRSLNLIDIKVNKLKLKK